MAKGNFIEYVISDDPNKYPNESEQDGYYYRKVVVGVEDVTPEVTAQTPVITQIAENLGVTITTPSGTNKQILQGNNANLLNIKNNAKKEGLYVWKKLTAEGGDFVDFVVSDSETAYPDGGLQDGYWYEKVVEGIPGIDFGTVTPTSSSLKQITINHALGIKPSYAVILKKSSWTLRWSDDIVLAGSSGFVEDRSSYSPHVYGSNFTSHTATTTSVTFGTNDSYGGFGRGEEYIWFVIA